MVVPWKGFELNQLLDQVGVQPGAKYVAFETLVRPDEMPGRRNRIDWPYARRAPARRGDASADADRDRALRRDLPNQNGAPIRLVVPWKYGFKSIKSIVRITLTDTQPPTTWNKSSPTNTASMAM